MNSGGYSTGDELTYRISYTAARDLTDVQLDMHCRGDWRKAGAAPTFAGNSDMKPDGELSADWNKALLKHGVQMKKGQHPDQSTYRCAFSPIATYKSSARFLPALKAIPDAVNRDDLAGATPVFGSAGIDADARYDRAACFRPERAGDDRRDGRAASAFHLPGRVEARKSRTWKMHR